MNKIIEKINKERQTVKSYLDKEISDSDWNQILDAIYWSPTSHGFEPYRVLVVRKSSKLRAKLQKVMWGQGVVVEADKLIFFVSLKRKVFLSKEWLYERALRKATEVEGKTGEEAKANAEKMTDIIINKHLSIDEPGGDDWAMKQSYIGLSAGLMAATILGIGSTPMEGLEKAKVEKLLRSEKLISDDERIAVAASFGYPASKTAYAHWGTNKRVRDPKDKKFKTI